MSVSFTHGRLCPGPGWLTTQGDSEALHNAQGVAQHKVAVHLVHNADGAGNDCLRQVSDGQVHQHPVQRVAQLLELHGGCQHGPVREDGGDEHEDHPDAGQVVHPSGGDVVIGAVEGVWRQETQRAQLHLCRPPHPIRISPQPSCLPPATLTFATGLPL